MLMCRHDALDLEVAFPLRITKHALSLQGMEGHIP
jgi:hypothetical protein